jgi:hypothetical protein
MTLNRKDAVAALILTGLALASWLPRLTGPIDLRWDGGAYYVLGTALAQGKGYRLLNEPGEIQTTLHPPMLPVIVALHQWILRTSDMNTVGEWLRRFYLLLFVVYVVAAYFLLRAFLPLGYAAPAALVVLLQLHTVFMSDLCFPELPFGLATVLFTLCKVKEGGRTRRFLRVPLAIISFALRTVGMALLAAWAAESIFQKRFKQAAWRLLMTLALMFGWAGYIAYVESGREYKHPAYEYQRADYAYINVSYARNTKYKDPFSPELGYASLWDKAKRFLRNATWMPVTLGEAVSTKRPIWDLFRTELNRRAGHSLLPTRAVYLILFLLAALILGGIGLLFAAREYFIPFYILFSLAVVCLTPWPAQFNRYLSPLSPFLSLSLFIAVRATVEQSSERFRAWPKVVGLGLVGAFVLLILTSQAATLFPTFTKWHQKVAYDAGGGKRVEYRLFFYHDLYRATDAGLDWLKSWAKENDVVAATNPQWAYLRTGMMSVLPPLEMDAAKAQRLLDTVPVKFLIVDEGDFKKYTTQVVAAYPDRWRRVYANSTGEKDDPQGKFEIYERIGLQ